MKLTKCRTHHSQCDEDCLRREPTSAAVDAGDLFDLFVESPNGLTSNDIKRRFDWSSNTVKGAMRALRFICGEDVITVVAEPQGESEPWLYRLVGNYDDARTYFAWRVGGLESQLDTVRVQAGSLVNGTDGRTTEGKKTRLIHEVVGSLQRQLQLMDR